MGTVVRWTCNTDGTQCSYPSCIPCDDARRLVGVDAGGKAIEVCNKLPSDKPLRLVMRCPRCKLQHIDEGEWATRVHHTHRCVDRKVYPGLAADASGRVGVAEEILRGCGFEWQPALVPTVGIERLGG